MPQIRPDVSNLLANLARASRTGAQRSAIESLDAATRLNRTGDTVSIGRSAVGRGIESSPRYSPENREIAEKLGTLRFEFNSLRNDISTTIRGGGGLGEKRPLEELQAELNRFIADIDAASTGGALESLPEISDIGGVRFTSLPEGVSSAVVRAPEATDPGGYDLDIEVLQPAEGASVDLRFNLNDRGVITEDYTFYISDQGGGRVLSVTSGTPLSHIRSEINESFDGRVQASLTTSGVVTLQGFEPSDDAFISVIADPGDPGGDDQLALFDRGADVVATVNGQKVESDGLRLTAHSLAFSVPSRFEVELSDRALREPFSTTLRAESLGNRTADQPLSAYLGRFSMIDENGPSAVSLQDLAGSGFLEMAASDPFGLLELVAEANEDLQDIAIEARRNTRPLRDYPSSPDAAPTAQEIVADAARNARTLGADGIDPSRVLDLLR